MTYGIPAKIIKDGFKGIETKAKEIVKDNSIELGDVFFTYPGRLNRRKLKGIYHAVIKRFPNDLLSLDTVKKAIDNAFKMVIKDQWNTVSICSFGLDTGEIEPYTSAFWIAQAINKYKAYVEIKVVDENKEFTDEMQKILENSN